MMQGQSAEETAQLWSVEWNDTQKAWMRAVLAHLGQEAALTVWGVSP
jgi:hypothetical protein